MLKQYKEGTEFPEGEVVNMSIGDGVVYYTLTNSSETTLDMEEYSEENVLTSDQSKNITGEYATFQVKNGNLKIMADKMTNTVETGKKALKNTVKALAALAAISGTQVQANDLLAKCDINRDGKINTGKEYRAGKISKQVVKAERNCKIDFDKQRLDAEGQRLDAEGQRLDKSIQKGKDDLEKLKEIKGLLVK